MINRIHLFCNLYDPHLSPCSYPLTLIMQLYYLLILGLFVAVVHGDCEDVADDRPEGCFDEPNIAKIVCFGEDPCVCKDGDSGEDTSCTEIVPADVLLEVTAAQMTGEKCREICEASKASEGNSSKCEYFRWEEVDIQL